MNEIKKFCIYGFLKNLRFFEPFFLLFLKEKELSFLSIGFLISFKEISKNILETPTGCISDLYGRKKTLMFSFIIYILAFIIFAVFSNYYLLYLAMFFMALADAFRTGTHKAIIVTYLEKNNMLDKKIKIHGYTRSWSKVGSAVSVIIGSAIVMYTDNYSKVFWFTIIPYLLSLINLYTYPNYLDAKTANCFCFKKTFKHLFESFYISFLKKETRSLLAKSFIFTGSFEAIKDYIQIFIKLQVLSMPIIAGYSLNDNIAILISFSYFFIFLSSSYAARKAHKINSFFNEKTLLYIFLAYTVVYFSSLFFSIFNIYILTIFLFLTMFILQNILRPIIISKFSTIVENKQLATVLSIESQSYSLSVFLLAPLIGYFADNYGIFTIFFPSLLLSAIYTFLYFKSTYKINHKI